jgi:glyoxylase-like metal-dependent hydrolase (beta-lactamase superfamily II)
VTHPKTVSWWSLECGVEGLSVEEIAPGVKRLSEAALLPGERSFFYLLEDTDRDCLIDGGWGFCSSLDGLRSDPEKPLVAIATHSHFDHIGMLHLAGERYGHAAEAAIFAGPDPTATQALPYLAGRPVLIGGEAVEPHSIVQPACPLDRFAGEGSRLELGSRRLDVIHTPGHSPGSICVLDAAAGLLFCADTIHDGHIHDAIPGADRKALLVSHQRLAQVDFQLALPGHGATLPRSAFLDRIDRYRNERVSDDAEDNAPARAGPRS